MQAGAVANPRTSATAAAGRTERFAPDADGGFQTADRIVEAQSDLVFQILSALGFTPQRLTRKCLVEDFGDSGSVASTEIEAFEGESPLCRLRAGKDSFGIETVLVVKLSLGRIAENFIGFR